MSTQQTEALAQECADYATSLRSAANVAKLEGRAPPVSFLRAADLFERAASSITELESQLAQRFDAADMATAGAQGFRDGVASVSAGSEPVAWREHVEQRLLAWRQSFVNRSGDQLALDDFMDEQSLDDLIDFVCDESRWHPLDAPSSRPGPADGESNELC